MPLTSVKIWQRSALQLGRERDGRRVRAAAAERRDLRGVDVAGRGRVLQALEGLGAHALEAGDDDDLAGGELRADAPGVDARDPRPAVAAVGGDAGLRAREADRRRRPATCSAIDIEGRALVLAGGEEHVQLAGIGLVRDGGGQGEELVRGVAHRGHDDDELGTVRALADDPPRDAPDALGVGHRRAAELHDDEGAGHGGHSTGGAANSATGRGGSVAAGCRDGDGWVAGGARAPSRRPPLLRRMREPSSPPDAEPPTGCDRPREPLTVPRSSRCRALPPAAHPVPRTPPASEPSPRRTRPVR